MSESSRASSIIVVALDCRSVRVSRSLFDLPFHSVVVVVVYVLHFIFDFPMS